MKCSFIVCTVKYNGTLLSKYPVIGQFVERTENAALEILRGGKTRFHCTISFWIKQSVLLVYWIALFKKKKLLSSSQHKNTNFCLLPCLSLTSRCVAVRFACVCWVCRMCCFHTCIKDVPRDHPRQCVSQRRAASLCCYVVPMMGCAWLVLLGRPICSTDPSPV